jgi:hypothetical protein
MRQIGHRESDAILGAMRQVALAGGHALTWADTTSVRAAGRYLLRRPDLSDIGTLPAVEPPDLVAVLKGESELAREAVKYLAIMALVDGTLDHKKLACVLGYSRAGRRGRLSHRSRRGGVRPSRLDHRRHVAQEFR